MAIIKSLEISGRSVAFDTSAAVPRIYRARFGRDFSLDLQEVIEEVQKNEKSNSHLPVNTLELFENIAYTMAKSADPCIPDTPEEWLGEFLMFSIYNVLPKLIEMWYESSETTSTSKKKAKTPQTAP